MDVQKSKIEGPRRSSWFRAAQQEERPLLELQITYLYVCNILGVDADAELTLVCGVESYTGGRGNRAHIYYLPLLARAAGSGGVSWRGVSVLKKENAWGGREHCDSFWQPLAHRECPAFSLSSVLSAEKCYI